MKRLIAVLAFAVGGLASELAHPVQCLLIAPSGVSERRRKVERS